MFRGRHDHTIDAKGRLSIPAGFRMEIQRRTEKPPILTRLEGHLELYGADDWENIERDLMAKSDLNDDVQKLRRFMVGNACDSPIDSQGRILIPSRLRTHAKLTNKVVLVGVLDKVEIWDADLYEVDDSLTLARLGTIRQSVSEQN
jgi:MraZ protein